MEPDKAKEKGKQGKTAREEFEAACYAKKWGRPPQRKTRQRRLAEFSDSTITAASHGEEPSPELDYDSPREDRAG